MIDQLITALSQEVEMSAAEIADTIWLALQMQEFQPESVFSGLPLTTEDQREINQKKSQPQATLPKTQPKNSELEETQNQLPEEQKAGIYPRNEQQTSKSSSLSIKVPDAPSLREPLTLARALKPLMRRVPSGRELVLDEAATIQRIAVERLWIPVLKPTVEPWLDLELVVDEAISMQIWRHTIKELERLLKNYGIFRDVRVWGLITNENEQVQIRRGIGAAAKNQTSRSPKELIDPTGRRLVLVVSDCVSSLWRNGELTPVLELWAKQGSMAIIQMLPKWLWKRTALGRASEVRLRGLTPGMFNQNLIAKEVSLWDELDEERGVKVPIFTLEPDKVATWAQMLSGKGNIWTSGYVFKLDPPVKKETGLFNLDHSNLSAEQRVQAFRVTASPMARKLAGLLASAPVISLPIVRLIRESMLKDSQQVHVAEVFLGGLLKPLSEINADTNPDYVQYEFMNGVRELLVDSVPSQYVLNVVDEVSKYVAKKVGLSLEDFAAVLRNTQQVRDSEIVEEVGYFATVTAQVLRGLGGEYVKVADSLVTNRPIGKVKTEFPEENRPLLRQQVTTKIDRHYILHLSDLHFGTTDDARLWSSQLAEDLRGLKCSSLDALVLSGDIANKSTPEEYTAAKNFLNKLCDEFSIKQQNIVLVPGNHDLNWELSKRAYILTDRENYPGELKPGYYIDVDQDIVRVRDEEKYKQRFSHFSKFYEDVKGEPYPERENQQSILYPLPAQKILFLGLNSAWNLDHYYKERASINRDALSNALKKIDQYSSWLKIAVWHHPLNSDSEDRIKDHGFMERLAKAGFCLALHGHIHKADNSLYRYDRNVGGRKIEVISAGIFGASTRELVTGNPWQYQLLELEDNTLRVRTRKREQANGAWKPDARWIQDEETSSASYEILLPPKPLDVLPSPFYGREKELEDLQQSISSGCRLIALLGMGGIGKTSLALELAGRMKNEFDYVIARSLQDFSSLDELLKSLLQLLSNQATKESDSVLINIARLKECLTKNRCLLLLDDAETILQDRELVGKYRQGYEEYDQLFNTFANGSHKSCLMLISTEKPTSIEGMEYRSRRVKSLLVKGVDNLSAKEIFKAKGFTGSEPRLTELIDYYQGNPLMLNLVASVIQKVFNGDIANFLINSELDFYGVRELLEVQFQSLSDSEKEIMYYLANAEGSVSLDELRNRLNRQRVTDVLVSLFKRGLINNGQNKKSYTVNSIVKQFLKRREHDF